MNLQKFKRHRYFHFTTKIIHPKWFEMTRFRNWLDLLSSLNRIQEDRFDETFTWHSAVLMSNHIHLLFSMEGYDEHSLILDLETAMMQELGIKKNLFQRPLPCEPLQHGEYLKAAYKYIYRNPVEAGLVRRVQDYPYSSLHLILNLTKPALSHPFVDPFEIIHDLPRRLKWLNTKLDFQDRQLSFDCDLGPGI